MQEGDFFRNKETNISALAQIFLQKNNYALCKQKNYKYNCGVQVPFHMKKMQST